jgi:methionyl-tRNA formyltransferase
MRVAVIGRTKVLLDAAALVKARGHDIAVVWTCRAEQFYDTKEEDFRALAARAGADFVDELSINSEANRKRLAAYGCDIAISVNWLTVIGQPVLDVFPFGVLNAHSGDLPRFRGNACPNWAILADEPHVGLCVHLMAVELDAGPVVLREKMALDDTTYIGDVYAWVERRAPEMFAAAVDGLGDGSLHPTPQPADPALALRAYPRRPEDSRIDWRWPSRQVLRMVRASSHPFSGAFAFLEGERKVTVWRAEAFAHPGPFLAVPGQVCLSCDGDPAIACGDGMIRLTDIDLEGAADSKEAKRLILRSLRHRLA